MSASCPQALWSFREVKGPRVMGSLGLLAFHTLTCQPTLPGTAGYTLAHVKGQLQLGSDLHTSK